jgi:hypothetical protein
MAQQNGRCLQCGGHLIRGFFSFRPVHAAAESVDAAKHCSKQLIAVCWSCNPEIDHV